MPIDLTFVKTDVPQLIDQLNASKYKAIYLDNEMVLRTNDNSIWISKDKGTTWDKPDIESVNATDFANWLLENDPFPGYSMKEMQRMMITSKGHRMLISAQMMISFLQ